MVQLSHPYVTTGQTIPLIVCTFVGKVRSLLFKTLSRFDIAILPRSKHLLISWPQSHCPLSVCIYVWGFPGGSDGKESACNVGDLGLIPGSGRSRGGGLSNPRQDSCLENPMDRGARWAAVHGDAELATAERPVLSRLSLSERVHA